MSPYRRPYSTERRRLRYGPTLSLYSAPISQGEQQGHTQAHTRVSEAMARNSQSHQEKRLLELLNSSANRNKCGECKTHDPTWASWNLGVFLCGRCASAHRSLGSDISRIKSLSMEQWSGHELEVLAGIGNKRNNKFWNEKQVPFPFDFDDKDSLITWLRDKYTGKYKEGAVTAKDYNLDDDWADTTDDYGYEKSKPSIGRRLSSTLGFGGRSRGDSIGSGPLSSAGSFSNIGDYGSGSGSGVTRSMRRTAAMYGSRSNDDYDDDYSARPRSGSNRYSSPSARDVNGTGRLTFRRPTNAESRKYGDQSRKMKYDMGFEDEDLNIEALVITHGNIPKAVELIKQSGSRSGSISDARSRSRSASRPTIDRNGSSAAAPSLPLRKETTGAIFDSTKAGGFNWLDEDSATNGAASTAATGQNQTTGANDQIYQYADPNTGAIYYIDAQGQQYVDPSQGMQTSAVMDPFQQMQAQPQMQTMATATGFQQMMPQQMPQQMPQHMPQQMQMQQPAVANGFAQGYQQQPMVTGNPFAQTSVNGNTELTLNQLQQQQQQQQQMMQQQQQMMMQQQQPQQPNYFGGF